MIFSFDCSEISVEFFHTPMEALLVLLVHHLAEFVQSIQGSCVVICEQDLKSLQQSLNVLGVEKNILTYPAVGQFPYDPAPPSAVNSIARLRTVQQLKTETNFCLLISPLAWLEKRPLLDDLLIQPLIIKRDDTWTHTHLIDMFSLFSYVRSDVVEFPGQYAVRGDRIDVFPPNLSYPVRIDFFGDTVEEVKRFDPVTQRSLSCHSREDTDNTHLYPATEYLIDATHIAYYKKTYAQQLSAIDQQMVESLASCATTKNLGHLWPLFYELSHHISHFWAHKPTIFIEPTINLEKIKDDIQRIYARNQEQGRFVLPLNLLYVESI